MKVAFLLRASSKEVELDRCLYELYCLLLRIAQQHPRVGANFEVTVYACVETRETDHAERLWVVRNCSKAGMTVVLGQDLDMSRFSLVFVAGSDRTAFASAEQAQKFFEQIAAGNPGKIVTTATAMNDPLAGTLTQLGVVVTILFSVHACYAKELCNARIQQGNSITRQIKAAARKGSVANPELSSAELELTSDAALAEFQAIKEGVAMLEDFNVRLAPVVTVKPPAMVGTAESTAAVVRMSTSLEHHNRDRITKVTELTRRSRLLVEQQKSTHNLLAWDVQGVTCSMTESGGASWVALYRRIVQGNSVAFESVDRAGAVGTYEMPLPQRFAIVDYLGNTAMCDDQGFVRQEHYPVISLIGSTYKLDRKLMVRTRWQRVTSGVTYAVPTLRLVLAGTGELLIDWGSPQRSSTPAVASSAGASHEPAAISAGGGASLAAGYSSGIAAGPSSSTPQRPQPRPPTQSVPNEPAQKRPRGAGPSPPSREQKRPRAEPAASGVPQAELVRAPMAVDEEMPKDLEKPAQQQQQQSPQPASAVPVLHPVLDPVLSPVQPYSITFTYQEHQYKEDESDEESDESDDEWQGPISPDECVQMYPGYENCQSSEVHDQQHVEAHFRQVDAEALNVGQHQLRHAATLSEMQTIAAMFVNE